MSLYNKHRPKTFSEMVGNKDLIRGLKSKVEGPNPPHVYLFTGPAGCGKTTLGHVVSNALGCNPMDFKEYNAANTRGIDTIRKISQNALLMPLAGDVKVYLFDECHKLTNDAQNALLKTLENPPEHSYFILATTEPQLLINTLKQRCSKFQVDPLKKDELRKIIMRVLRKEGKTKAIPKSVIKEIIRLSANSGRVALVLLEHIIDLENESDMIGALKESKVMEKQVVDLCRAIAKGESWKTITSIIKDIKEDAERVRYAILGYLTAILLNSSKPDPIYVEMIACFEDSFMYTGKAGLVIACYYAIGGE